MMQAGSRRALFWLALFALIIVFLSQIQPILLPFVVGMLTAYFLDPAADKLQASGLSRASATVVITVTFFSALMLLLIAIIPLISQQLTELVLALPDYARTLTERYSATIQLFLERVKEPDQLEAIRNAIGNMSGVAVQVTGDVLANIFASGLALMNVVSLLLVTPVVAFYLLRDWDRLVAHMDALLPRQHAETIRQQLWEIDRRIAGFVRGQFTVMLILAAFYGIGLTLAGLRFGLLIGIVAGFLTIIPYLGVFISMVIGVGLALMQFDELGRVAIVLGVFAVGLFIEGNFITPKLVGDRVGLHPVWLIFGLLAGGALFGFVGVLIAVPVTAVIGVLVRFAISRYLQSGLYRGNESLPPPATPAP